MQADIGRCGGITEWLRVAALAAAHHVPFSGHCGPAIHLHAATAPPNLRHLEYFHDHVRIENLLFDGIVQPRDGTLTPSDAPGNGYTLKAADAERVPRRVAHCSQVAAGAILRCMSSDTPPPPAYVLGHSDAEIERLELQARRIDPVTRRIFTAAGLEPGMRVLDVGSGAGDVALLVADVVGTGGEVVGFDRSSSALEIARDKVAARGLTNVTFVAGDADEVTFDQPFDAVVGRYVLQFQSDPSATLARVASFARPGGVVAFHEIDWSGVSSTPPAPTFDRLHVWLEEAIRRSGANTHSGLSMPSVFRGAGLPEPELRLESLLGASSQARVAVERMVGLATSLLPVLTAEGIVTADELDVDTLFDRMMAEIVADNVLIRSHLEIGAWSRV